MVALRYAGVGDHNIIMPCLWQKPASVLIYIGKAGNGVKRRWLKDRWAHCKAMSEILEAKTRYEEFKEMESRCDYMQLVDCYLAWALLRGFSTALFVVCSACPTDLKKVEGMMQRKHRATIMCHGLNGRLEN